MHVTRTLSLLATLAMLSAGCFGGSDAAPVQARGQVVTVGGPGPGAPAPVGNASLKLVGDHTYVVRTDADGNFRVEAVPGRYQVKMTGNAPEADGRPIQPLPGEVTVPSPDKPLKIVIPIR
jgi:hypothetical protein